MIRSPRTLVLGTGRSTTRRVLLVLSAGLVLATTAVFATGLTVFTRTHDTTDTVRNRTVPAIQGILAARTALVQADRAAVRSFTTDADLVGPGEEFLTQIAIANQSLTKVAEDNEAGERGSRHLQLIGGLLVTYTGLIGQADAHFRQPDGDLLGTVDLWSASYMLHRPGGILAQLDALLGEQQDALNAQVGTSAMTGWTVLVLALPILALCVVLAVTHVFFRRRFRRWVSPGLVVATLALVALTWVVTRPMSAQQHLEESQTAVRDLVARQQEHIATLDGMAREEIRVLLAANGCDTGSNCGTTIDRFFPDRATAPAVRDTPSAVVGDTRADDRLSDAVNATAGLAPFVYLFAILVVVATAFAFRPRLNEYRYRSR